MSDRAVPETLRLLTFEVLCPIRDFVIDHGAEEQPGHPLKYVRMKLDDEAEELVICAHAVKEHVRMRISYGDSVPSGEIAVVVFNDDPESWLQYHLAVDPQDLITLSTAIRAGYDIIDSARGEKN